MPIGTKKQSRKYFRISPMFARYAIEMIVRLVLLIIAVTLFIASPTTLDLIEQFSISDGVTFIDVVFIIILLDMLRKLNPKARIAIGSRKQYRRYYKPAPEMSNESQTKEIERTIRSQHKFEILPVIAAWLLLNTLIALVLFHFGWLTPQICLLWTLVYFASDMICVVVWCPFQTLLMRNRCCTTCRIFNWDAIMAVTPLVFAPCPFSWILISIALIVLIRWEVTALSNPEQFDERSNATLSCACCTDKLCVLRRPINDKKGLNDGSK